MTRVLYGPGFPGSILDELHGLFGVAADSVFGNDSDSNDEKTARPVPLPIDVEHFENEVIARADAPGATAEEVEVEAVDDLVTIFVNVKEVSEEGVKADHSRYERPERKASKRSFRVRRDFDPAEVKAELVNGVLTVTVPLKPVAKPVTVTVSTTPTTK